MGKYIFLKILYLVIFAAAFIVVPLALPIVLLIVLVSEGIRALRHGSFWQAWDGSGWLLIIVGIALCAGGFTQLQKITDWFETDPNAIPLVWSIITVWGGWQAISISKTEARSSVSTTVMKVTGLHPYLLMISGAIRAVGILFLSELAWLGVLETVGIIMFIVAIVMYIVRTVHVVVLSRQSYYYD